MESVRTDPIPCKFRPVIATNAIEGILANPAFQSHLTEKSAQILIPNEWKVSIDNLRKYINFPLHVYETDTERIIRDIHARQARIDENDHANNTERERLILLLDNAITFSEIDTESLLEILNLDPVEEEQLRSKGYREVLSTIIDRIIDQESTSDDREQ